MDSRARLHAELTGFLREQCPVCDERHLVLLGWMVTGLLVLWNRFSVVALSVVDHGRQKMFAYGLDRWMQARSGSDCQDNSLAPRHDL